MAATVAAPDTHHITSSPHRPHTHPHQPRLHPHPHHHPPHPHRPHSSPPPTTIQNPATVTFNETHNNNNNKIHHRHHHRSNYSQHHQVHLQESGSITPMAYNNINNPSMLNDDENPIRPNNPKSRSLERLVVVGSEESSSSSTSDDHTSSSPYSFHTHDDDLPDLLQQQQQATSSSMSNISGLGHITTSKSSPTLIKIRLDNRRVVKLNITKLNANCRLCLAFIRYLNEQKCKLPNNIPIYI